ncbi:MAG: hypothetical protein ACYCS8_17900 [Acidithiobacillus sp.]
MENSNAIRKNILAVAVIAALGFASAAEAGTVMGRTQAEHSAIVAANNEVGIAITGNLTNYQESVTPGPADTESGWQPGFAVKGSYMGNVYGIHNVYAAVHYANSFGNIGYYGAVGKTPYNGTDSASFNRVMGRVGMGIRITCPHEMMITPYVAGGYQGWNRNLQGPYGYTENYSAGLVGAGALFQYAVAPSFVVSGDTEVLAVVGGGMTPHILNGRLGSASFGTSAEEKMTLGVDYRITGHLHTYSDVSLTHFTYTGGHLAIPGAYEPSSATNQLGMSLGLAYQF